MATRLATSAIRVASPGGPAGGVLASITPPSNVDVDVIWPLAPLYSVNVPAYALPLQPWRNAVRPVILSPAKVALFQLGPQ